MKYIHNSENWFDGNLLGYFNIQFTKNTIGDFKAPNSTAKRFNNLNSQADMVNLIDSIGNVFIDAVIASAKGTVLKLIPFT